MTGWLNVVGIDAGGLDGLAATTRNLVARAELLVGGKRHLAMVANDNARKLAWEFPLDNIVAELTRAKISGSWCWQPAILCPSGSVPSLRGISRRTS